MNYTKGEWYHLIDKENCHWVMSRGKTGDMEQNVAAMSVRPEAEANAQLIASAPLLYEALKDALNTLDAVDNLCPTPNTQRRIKEALAKAGGE